MNYSVANKKYKKYVHLLKQEPKNALFKRKLEKYDEMRGGAKRSKSKNKKVKGFRVMTGGSINFEEMPPKVENELLSKKEEILSADKQVIEAAGKKIAEAEKCEKVTENTQQLAESSQALNSKTEELASKTKEFEELKTAYEKLKEEKSSEATFKERCDALEKKTEAQLATLTAEIEKLKEEKGTLRQNAEKYVTTLSSSNKETVAGLEQMINDYHASMENLRASLGLKE